MTKRRQVPPDDTTPGPSKQLLLNVIFHGPFLFFYYQSHLGYAGRVDVVTPVTPEHVAVAGTWLKEKPCHYGTFFLTGITTPQCPFDPSKNVDKKEHVIVDAPSSINIEQGSYYRFVLPPPSSEKALAVAKIGDKKIFVGSYADNIEATCFGTVHVLSYEIKEGVDTPQLEDLQWRPEPSKYKNVVLDQNCKAVSSTDYSFATNLHIYAEAPFAPDPFHPVRDFGQMVNMLPGLSLGLVQQFPELQFEDPKNNDDFGIIREEQGGLRGLPPFTPPFTPPLVCDAPSIAVTGAKDPIP